MSEHAATTFTKLDAKPLYREQINAGLTLDNTPSESLVIDTSIDGKDDQASPSVQKHPSHTKPITADQISSAMSEEGTSSRSMGSWSDPRSSTVPTSVSQNADHNDSHESALESTMTFYSYNKHPDELDDGNTDLESVVSSQDDIQSQADSSTAAFAQYRQTAIRYYVDTFAKDAELYSLYQGAVRGMARDKFIRNHTRLLKKLFLGLDLGEASPLHKLALNFLRSRNRRNHISAEIYRIFNVSDDAIRDQISLMVRDEAVNFSTLDRYLESLDLATKSEGLDIAASGKHKLLTPVFVLIVA